MIDNPPLIFVKTGIHFSRHIPCFEGVAKALKPRLFPLSVIRAKEEIDCKVDPCLREDDGQRLLRSLATVSIAGMTMVYSKLPIPNFMRSLTRSAQTRLND